MFERWTKFLHDESERLRKEKRSENPVKSERCNKDEFDLHKRNESRKD